MASERAVLAVETIRKVLVSWIFSISCYEDFKNSLVFLVYDEDEEHA